MYVCVCGAITDKDIENYIKSHPLATTEELMLDLNVANTCGSCEDNIDMLIKNLLT